MDNRNVNIEMEELFRKKLEYSELDPGATVRQTLMRKLGRKEFVRFNPARFNVYYLGGVVIAGIVATLIIISEPAGKKENNEVIPREQILAPDSGAIIPDVNQTQEPGTKETKTGSLSKPETAGVDQKSAGHGNNPAPQSTSESPEGLLRVNDDTPQKAIIRKEIAAAGNVSGASIDKKPIADFNTTLLAGCLPLRVRFLNRSVSYDSCVWTFGDGGFSVERDPEWIFDEAGEYKVSLRVYGNEGSESVFNRMITVYPKPVARFETLPEKPILPDDEIRFFNYSMDAVKFKWEFGDGKSSEAPEPEHKYDRYGNYNVSLVAWSAHGCSDSLMVNNAYAVSGCYIDFPNAFIPNADGPSGGNYSYKSDESAQIFHPVTSGVSEYQLRVFSKLGILIFEANDINTGWDGYHKGQLCESGVYIWKVRGTFKNGESFVKMGDVTLLRK